MTEPIIAVVEDNPVWQDELGLMYSRILRGQSNHENPCTDIHQNVKCFSTAKQAISFLKRKPGDRKNAKSKVDILSLDVNLRSSDKATGLTVLRKAVEEGNKFVTIGISGLADDDDLKNQISDREYDGIQAFEAWISLKTNCKSFYYPKRDISRRSVKDQVRDIEKTLLSKVKHGNILRLLAEELRVSSAADLNGKYLCLHFRVPRTLYGIGDAVVDASQAAKLAKLNIFREHFLQQDLETNVSALLTRLMFLADPGRRHRRYGARSGKHPFFIGVSLQDDPSEPDPEDAWLTNRQGAKIPSEGEIRDLLCLMARKWDASETDEAPWKRWAIKTYDTAMAADSAIEEDLFITGIRPNSDGSRATGSTASIVEPPPSWSGSRDFIYANGQSLALRLQPASQGRDADNTIMKQNQTIKTRISRVRKMITDLVGHETIDPIVEVDKAYYLVVPGQVFIHKGE